MKGIERALDFGIQFLGGQRVERLKRFTGSGVDACDCHSIGLTRSAIKKQHEDTSYEKIYDFSTGCQWRLCAEH